MADRDLSRYRIMTMRVVMFLFQIHTALAFLISYRPWTYRNNPLIKITLCLHRQLSVNTEAH